MDPVTALALLMAGLALTARLLAYLVYRTSRPSVPPPPEASEPSGEREEAERPPTARLVVGEKESLLHLPDGRTVRIPYTDYRALGEAGKYLVPGAVLVVTGMALDEAAQTAGHVLEVMGARLVWE